MWESIVIWLCVVFVVACVVAYFFIGPDESQARHRAGKKDNNPPRTEYMKAIPPVPPKKDK